MVRSPLISAIKFYPALLNRGLNTVKDGEDNKAPFYKEVFEK